MAALKSPKVAKAGTAADCRQLEQLPNIGPALAADLRRLGIRHPAELRARDPFQLYQALCRVTDKRQDPCVLDTFIAITDFMRGASPAPWWHYTEQRKRTYGSV
ncbi:MAG TPA: helix-hairpin-helix domain-containing protein [Rubrivivax sp.]|nr:helix-hairpin-helix domain-containing protein [Rubrivivax sp.]